VFECVSNYLTKKAKDKLASRIQPKMERFMILERQAEACAMDAEARLPIWQEMMSIGQYISEQLESAKGFVDKEEYLKIKMGLAVMRDDIAKHSVR
jgi:hypothetical protein